jgi:IMP dehydrogenase/GMP reductase
MSSRPELEKLTAIKLRELIAAEYPEIQGAHAMKKEELVVNILKDVPITDIKKTIRQLKTQQAQALEAKDAKKNTELRKKIAKLKRKTRMIVEKGLKKTKKAKSN